MRLIFPLIKVTKKVEQPYINTILYQFVSDEDEEFKDPVVLDRKQTEYTFITLNGEYYLSMLWRDVYIWDGDEIPVPEKFSSDNKYIDNGYIIGIELEDDCPHEDYEIISFDNDIPVLEPSSLCEENESDMKTYKITVKDEASYIIKTDNIDTAKELTVTWFDERKPEIIVEETDEKPEMEISSF